jgi:hypothetical protein
MADDDRSFLSRRLHSRRDDSEDGAVTRSAAELPTPRRRYDLDFWDDDAAGPEDLLPVHSAPIDAASAGPSFERRDLERMDEEALDRRRQLWRDTAVVLSALVVILLAANVVLPQIIGLAASASGAPSETSLGPGPRPVDGAGPTSPPIGNPSPTAPGPTRAPAITLPPTGTSAPPRPAATPRPTPRPTRTPVPPTAQPTDVPTAQPTEAPQDTPPPTPGETAQESAPPGP